MVSVLAQRQPPLRRRPSRRPSSISFRPDNFVTFILGSMARAALLAVALGVVGAAADRSPSDLQPELQRLLVDHLKFSSGDLSDLEHGKIVRHALPATSSGEMAAVGGVRIRAGKAQFVAAYRDIVHFKKNPNVLEIGRFSNPPELPDLD